MTAWFALTGNFQYFTGLQSAYTEKESAISQMYWLLFCLTSSQKEKEKKEERSTVRECACVCSRLERELGVC